MSASDREASRPARSSPAARRDHVIILAPGFIENGGCASHAQKLALGLSSRGNDVTVISRHGTASRVRRMRAGRVRVIEFPGFGRPAIGAVLYLLGGGAIAVVRGRQAAGFLSLQLSSPASIGAVASTIWGAPFAALSTSTGPRGEVAEATRGWRRLLRGPVLRRATWLVGQTDDACGELRRLRASAVVTVPTPIVALPMAPGLNGMPRALYAGRLVRGKNLDVLVRAWRLVLDARADARLTIAGVGVGGDATDTEIRALLDGDPGLAASIDLPGWVNDVSALLTSHDVFVLLSDAEGMSNALLEAAAHGRVCVVSDIPSNRAVLGADHPLSVAARDERRIAQAIVEAFDDPAIRSYARKRSIAAAARSDLGGVCETFAELLALR